MPDNDYTPEQEAQGGFKEAVCIDAMRIYDSCSEKQIPSYRYMGTRKTSSRNSAGFAPFSL